MAHIAYAIVAFLLAAAGLWTLTGLFARMRPDAACVGEQTHVRIRKAWEGEDNEWIYRIDVHTRVWGWMPLKRRYATEARARTAIADFRENAAKRDEIVYESHPKPTPPLPDRAIALKDAH